MAKIKVERKDWVLLVLTVANGRTLSPIQLQKSLFLLGKKVTVGKDYYEFSPYDYGPFCAEIYNDAEVLEEEGLIYIGYGQNLMWRVYSITPEGLKKGNKIKSSLAEKKIKKIDEIVELVLGMGFRELIKSIYQEFPEYSVNSVFRG